MGLGVVDELEIPCSFEVLFVYGGRNLKVIQKFCGKSDILLPERIFVLFHFPTMKFSSLKAAKLGMRRSPSTQLSLTKCNK